MRTGVGWKVERVITGTLRTVTEPGRKVDPKSGETGEDEGQKLTEKPSPNIVDVTVSGP